MDPIERIARDVIETLHAMDYATQDGIREVVEELHRLAASLPRNHEAAEAVRRD